MLLAASKMLLASCSEIGTAERLESRALLVAGALDTSFLPSITEFNRGNTNADQALAIAIQSDGKVLVAGSVEFNNPGDTDFGIARYLSNGTLDTSFSSDGKQTISLGPSSQAFGVAIDSSSRIVVAGTTYLTGGHFGGNHDFAVTRLLSNGNLDTSFSGDGKQTVAFDLADAAHRQVDQVRGVALQSDGKIVLAGSVKRSSQDWDFGIARLNTNGNLDTSFDGDGKRVVAFDLGNEISDLASAVAIASNKIIVVGKAGKDTAIVRLNSNGSNDSTFGSNGKKTFDLAGSSNFDEGKSVKVASDGKILIAGVFFNSSNGGSSKAFVARLTSSGSLDTSFGTSGKTTFEFNDFSTDSAAALAIQSNGRIVAAGTSNFTIANGDGFLVRRLMNS